MGIYSESIIKLLLCNCLKLSHHPEISTENLAHEKAKTDSKTKARLMHVFNQ